MKSITIGELKKIFEKYTDEIEVCYEYDGNNVSIFEVLPEGDINGEIYLTLR